MADPFVYGDMSSKSAESDPVEVGDIPPVVPWNQRDQGLHLKLRRLFLEHYRDWALSAKARGEMFAEKWHVGRAMLDWFYCAGFIDADEFQRANSLYSRPNKPSYPMYRITWINTGRASDEVASICSVPRTGPSPGYLRSNTGHTAADDDAASEHMPPPSPRSVAGWQADLQAEQEIDHAGSDGGGWVYCWGYELGLEQARLLKQDPLVKVGHTSHHYVDRIRRQVRGVWCPDAPKVLRAYRVPDSARVESEVHRQLKLAGRHHWRAGGTEWFRVQMEELDAMVVKAVASLAKAHESRCS